MSVHYYSPITKNPTSEAWIYWIDDTSGADGSNQTVTLGNESKTVAGAQFEPSGAYYYHERFDGLDSNTSYDLTISSGETVNAKYKTVPENPVTGGHDLTIGVVSDQHPYRGSSYMDNLDPNATAHADIALQEPDLVLIPGDFPSTRIQCKGSSTASDILQAFDEYHMELHHDDGTVVPWMFVKGNHERGHAWSPENSKYPTVNPDPINEDNDRSCSVEEGGYYGETLWPNMVEYSDDEHGQQYGHNYNVVIDDELQILGHDCIGNDNGANHPDNHGDWLNNVYRDDLPLVLAIDHFGTLHSIDRDPNGYCYLLRSNLAEFYASKPNFAAMFTGHYHNRGISNPISYSETDPGNVDWKQDLEYGGWTYAKSEYSQDTYREFSGGWPTSWRSDTDIQGAFEQLTHSGYEQHYILRIGNPTLTIEERSYDNGVQNTYDYDIPEKVKEVTAESIVRVTATVENVGGEAGDQNITLKRNGAVVDEDENVQISASDSDTIILDWQTTSNDVGEHTLIIESENDEGYVHVEVVE